jgi:sporulation protein YlmC with PRC-barrel domain
MRLSELLGCAVQDRDGHRLGTVTDVRLAQIGKVDGPGAELVVESLLVSRRATGSLFGYERRSEQGPWLVRAVVRWMHRNGFLVIWDDVADWRVTDRAVVLAPGHRRRPTREHPA